MKMFDSTRRKIAIGGLSGIGGLLISGGVYLWMNSPSKAERELALQVVPMSQSVCTTMKTLARSYDGTFQIPTGGVYLEPTHLEIDMKLSSAETVACQFLGPDLREYVSYPHVKDLVQLRRQIFHHTREIKSLVGSLQLETRDVAPILNLVVEIERVIPSPPSPPS